MTGILEYRIASCGEKYRPEFRRSPTERWWFMRNMDFPSATAAKTAADRLVELDEASRAPAHIIELEPEPLGSIDDWRRQKKAEAVAERERVFGAAGPSRLFVNGREIEVKRLGRRARA